MHKVAQTASLATPHGAQLALSLPQLGSWDGGEHREDVAHVACGDALRDKVGHAAVVEPTHMRVVAQEIGRLGARSELTE